MSQISSDPKTESLAKKLAQSNNEKCNFKYLMNSKTKRSCKSIQPLKQNQIESVIINSAHKLANKSLKTISFGSQMIENTRIPLSLQSQSLSNREETQTLHRFQNQQKPKTYDSEEFKFHSKVKTEVFEVGSSSIACMTDDCYHEKELLIKIDLLKKQRDEIWNSISGIVKQNLTLKEIVANFTIDCKTTQTALVQTQAHQANEIEMQTDLQGAQINEQYQAYLQSKKELEEAKSFCLKIFKKEQQQNYSSSLKDLFIETLNINLLKLTTEFQKQKEFQVLMNDQQIQQWKQIADKLKIELEHQNLKVQESVKSRENIKRVYQREIQELKSLVEAKEISFINQILQIKQDWQYVIQNSEMKHKFYLDYFENTKYCFKEKQAMYSTLLSQSHKTISNLMNQVKQFQAMANSNYHKHIQNQKSKNSVGNVFKTSI